MDKTILIAAGGTGGHIYPALSLARELRKRGCEVFFVVRKNDVSLKLLDKENFKHFELNISGLPRGLSPKLLLFILRLFVSFFNSIRIIKHIKPAAIAGLGGYVSFAPAFAGKLFGIPVIIHEQNILPGISNRILSKIADKIAVSFPDAQKYFRNRKVIVTGNPVREEVINISRGQASEKLKIDKTGFTVMIFGGSQGAHAINVLFVSLLAKLVGCENKIQFVHITGEKDFQQVKKEYESRKFAAAVEPYMYDIGNAYAVSDLVICRAGAMTITELIALKKPAILIPFPYASENHQEFNANYLASRNAAIMIKEKDLSADSLSRLLLDFLNNPKKIQEMKDFYLNVPVIKNSSQIFADLFIE